MKYIVSLILAITFNFATAQIEPINEKFFSTSKEKIMDAYFTVVIGNPVVKDGGYEFDVSLTANSRDENVKTFIWMIQGKQTDLVFNDSTKTKTFKLTVPFAPKSHFTWQEHKKYSVTLTVLNEDHKMSWPMTRKIKFNVVRAGRKTLGNDFSYEITRVWLASI